eukprot:scaffold270966_cov38-Prasinocladus_malaysianus.AAC.1
MEFDLNWDRSIREKMMVSSSLIRVSRMLARLRAELPSRCGAVFVSALARPEGLGCKEPLVL